MRISCATLFSVLLLALPSVASAQQTVTSLDVTIIPAKINLGGCENNLRVSITAKDTAGVGIPNLTDSPGWSFSVAKKQSCQDGVALAKSLKVSGTEINEFSLTGTELVRTGLNLDCKTEALNVSLFVCAEFTNDTGTTVTKGVPVQVNTTAPNVPVLDSVSPGDSRLHLRFSPASGDTSPAQWQACFRRLASTDGSGLEGDVEDDGLSDDDMDLETFADDEDGDGEVDEAGVDGGGGGGGGLGGTDGGGAGTGGPGGTGGIGGAGGLGGAGGEGGDGEAGAGGAGGTGGNGEAGSGGTIPASDICDNGTRSQKVGGFNRSLTIEGLRNGVTYEVAVRAIDENGNESAPSALLQGTPLRTVGFWDLYKEAGGEEEGGCNAAGGPAWLGLMAAGLFFASRFNGRR